MILYVRNGKIFLMFPRYQKDDFGPAVLFFPGGLGGKEGPGLQLLAAISYLGRFVEEDAFPSLVRHGPTTKPLGPQCNTLPRGTEQCEDGRTDSEHIFFSRNQK